jgi:uncharacterized membrane protein
MKAKRYIKKLQCFTCLLPVVPLYMSTCVGTIQSTCYLIAKVYSPFLRLKIVKFQKSNLTEVFILKLKTDMRTIINIIIKTTISVKTKPRFA